MLGRPLLTRAPPLLPPLQVPIIAPVKQKRFESEDSSAKPHYTAGAPRRLLAGRRRRPGLLCHCAHQSLACARQLPRLSGSRLPAPPAILALAHLQSAAAEHLQPPTHPLTIAHTHSYPRPHTEFLATLMTNPELVRNVAVVGHLHHGKTSVMDMFVEQTHELQQAVRAGEKALRFTDTRFDEQVRRWWCWMVLALGGAGWWWIVDGGAWCWVLLVLAEVAPADARACWLMGPAAAAPCCQPPCSPLLMPPPPPPPPPP